MNETKAYIHESLKKNYPPEEINSFIRWIFESVCNLSYQQQILYKDTQISFAEKECIRTITERLQKMEPLQYILGKCNFYGRDFEVNPSVLIPRPETEELIDRIIRTEKTPGLRILDIGTGSGCIAVTLAKNLQDTKVYAIDISEAALTTARKNAEHHHAAIRFIQADILSDKIFEQPDIKSLDIIVSNPPYIKENEKDRMLDNVLCYEPHQALFVPDNDPLLFYNQIAALGQHRLNTSGRIYLEINTVHGADTVNMLNKKGFRQVELLQDLTGKDRFVKAIK